MIVSPGQLTQRSEFYHQLNQLTAAGLGLVAALGQLKRNPPAPSYRAPLEKVLAQLTQGQTFSEALRAVPRWLPAFDITLVEAGETSGRLDACFRLLADYYTDRARIARQVISDLAYPAFLFHFAVFIAAFLQYIQSGHWIAVLVGGLVPIYAVILLLLYAGQSKRGENWRSWVESIVDPVPVLGAARRYLALARLSASLEALISAGVNIVTAWEMAGAASGSPALRRAVLAWRPQVEAGQTPAEAVSASLRFPEMFVSQYQTGEISGKLDETLRRLHQYYQEEGTRKLHAVSQWVPRLIYLAVVFAVAFFIIRYYTGYFQQLQNLGF